MIPAVPLAARFMLHGAAFVILVAGMKAAAPLLVPFLLAIFIALICAPPVTWLKGHGVPAWVALTLMVLAILLAAALVGTLVGNSIAEFRQDLPGYQQRLLDFTAGLDQWLRNHELVAHGSEWRDRINPAAVMQFAGNMLASLASLTTNGFLILLTVVFILAEQVGFRDKLAQARNVPAESLAAIGRFTHSVHRYLGLKTLTSLLTGMIAGLGLWVLEVDYAMMWALLVFLLNYVPTIGSIVAAVPPVLLALVQLGPGSAVLAAVLMLAANTLVGNILEPRWMGKGLNLSPLVVFVSLVFWGWVLGPVGMLLSVPLTMLVKIALENDPGTRWLGIMLGQGDPVSLQQPPPPPEDGGNQ